MIELQPATDEEFLTYEGEFDWVMRLTDETDLLAIKLAAEARINQRQSTGEVPFQFDTGVRKLPTQLQSMMMNAACATDFKNLLVHYAQVGYMHAENDEDLTVEEARGRAERLAKDIEIGSQVLDVVGFTDFDAFPMAG